MSERKKAGGDSGKGRGMRQASFEIYYPTLHKWDYMSFANKDRAVLHADRRATCFSVHKVGKFRLESVSHADAEYLRCPRLDGECTKSCYYRKWKTYGGGNG